ncbi:MAG: alpha-glucuronidase family glycosyl hydrolase [Terracidiphilus sp.]
MRARSWRRKIGFFLVFAGAAILAAGAAAQTPAADQAWLNYALPHPRMLYPRHVRALGSGALEQSAVRELLRNLGNLAADSLSARAQAGLGGHTVVGTADEVRKAFPAVPVPAGLEPESFWIYSAPCSDRYNGCGEHNLVVIAGGDERGVLYGAFALLRLAASGDRGKPPSLTVNPMRGHPAMPIRWVDEWDNANGTVERGYAGRSIFFEDGKVRDDLTQAGEYARLLASVGINGCNVNNVNGAAPFLAPDMIEGLARIADAMRPWGVRLGLSVDIASPQKIGGLKTFDPLDPEVKAWWAAKVNEIYGQIPDFAGFTVKADSEGQAGPASYGRSPADAANLLANALAPHGGVVLYRAFVYNNHLDYDDRKADRARAAYDIFHPLDGQFAPNVIVQIKYGPIDFQAEEPVSPLFAGLRKTNEAMEVQITQEYLGQQRHLVYLAPLWKEKLDFDLRAESRSTPVKQILEGKSFDRPLGGNPGAPRTGLRSWGGGLVGVADVGRDGWLGAPLAMANLYAFGRLAWNPDLTPDAIAAEWTRQTIGTDPEVVATVDKMLMQSWPAYVHYTGFLGSQTLTDVTGSHYGPNIESSERNGWGQWHRDDAQGIGMDRTVATGTGFIGQYPPEVAKMYESLATCPDNLLLFFHHLPWTYKLHSGKTVIQYVYDSHYQGAAEAAHLGAEWATLKGKIDPALYEDESARLAYQAGHAIVWRDAIVQYFLKESGIPDALGRAGHYPGRMEAEDARLTGYSVFDVRPWEDASAGKAVWCRGATSQRAVEPKIQPVLYQPVLYQPVLYQPVLYQGTTSVVPQIAAKEIGALAPAATSACTAEWTYAGNPGRFDVAVQYFDLQGGTAHFTLSVNGNSIASWAADASLPSRRPDGDNSTRYTARGVALKPGDVLRVEGTPDGADPAALDYLEIEPEHAAR